MRNFLRYCALAVVGLVVGAGIAAGQGAGVGFVTTPPTGSYFNIQTTSPTNVGITAANLASWVGSGGSMTNIANSLTVGSGVNQVSLAGAATGVTPIITTGGTSSDTNIGITLTGKGTGLVHLGGTTIANGSVRVPTVTSAVNALTLSGAVTGVEPFITVGGSTSDTNVGLAVYGKGSGLTLLGDSTSTLAGLQVAKTSSAVNGLLVTPGATGTRVALSAGTAGADANVGISMTGAGTGTILLGGATTTLAGLQVAQTASRVNGVVVTPGATGTFASITSASAGADAAAGLFIAGNSTGPVYIGGTTTTLAGLQVAQTASRVNSIVVTPSATTVVPSIAIGGAGADANRNLSVAGAGTGIVTLGGAIATCSGTTTSSCAGQRFISTVTGLTTAASTESAAMTVTNASVVSSASIVHCQVNIYAGTGNPTITRITPGTGSVSFTVQNVATGAALNANVPVACVVF